MNTSATLRLRSGHALSAGNEEFVQKNAPFALYKGDAGLLYKRGLYRPNPSAVLKILTSGIETNC